ncbi:MULTISPECIES: acyl-ACP--UDP-N-acetylglucosamine O-acyltransferase [Thiorhodovibrio]|uniref:acyl-ACP--UDP-N-acetylglucosamine O-acyltransferase n=1 Tax=Thiorhodovibrio TaxID=61593 RepID=UPI0019134DE1|nr:MULTISPECIES: acyl-ACP--UDP-N-acetylglucosamine O-acyltransferase [Thiorhodovibrio]MBK5968703.1 acyl-[acyl-carrier-protein]--UDP-N-acetylglucosamine O-acyltransferase [Thiorhodovibrio winogradskyi]WPL10939.1 Acyl-[acyl-carrier-protein]--UDP-N-acetylglucosamine O-acyltransferase [Thiorhodovibrio litoralis]
MIHPSAVIDPDADLHPEVEVGPFAVIGAEVSIGPGCRIGSHAVIKGPTRIGEDNQIYQFAVVGEVPQDKKFAGERSELVIGDRNVIREFATLHRGTAQDQGVTRIGNDNLLMAYTHVAHDCRIGNNAIMANAASLGGHIQIDDWAILGGFTIVHQFCRLGTHCFTSMGSVVSKDIPPFVTVSGHPARARGVNVEGLRRRNFSAERIALIRQGYRLLYRSGLLIDDAVARLRDMGAEAPDLALMADFVAARARSLLR